MALCHVAPSDISHIYKKNCIFRGKVLTILKVEEILSHSQLFSKVDEIFLSLMIDELHRIKEGCRVLL